MRIMDVNEFNESYLTLNEETKKAIKELESLTGKEVIFRLIKNEEAHTYFKLKIKLAREIMDNHIIVINEDNIDNKEELNYWIVHEIVHGLRLFSADKSDRVTFKASNSKLESLNEKIWIESESKFKKIGIERLKAMSYINFLTNNTFQLLYNSAVDARIEMYIYNNYPALRDLQKQAQKNYAKSILESFDKKRAVIIPDWVLIRVNAMNYAYLTKVTPIIGSSWRGKANTYKASGFRDLVNKLIDDLEKEDNGQITDIESCNYWAEVLDIKDYFRFDDFENIDYLYTLMN